MSRLDIKTPDRAQMMVDQLYHDMERRIAASPPGLCPVDMAMNFLNLCHAQTCGKCVPCRVGLGQLSILLGDVLEGRAKPRHMEFIEETAQSIASTAACAIGRHAAQLVLDGVRGFADDYWEHIHNHRCLGNLENPVPCVALCPAGIDIPGYIALISAGRCEDAIRLIRKDNPFPVACAYICEHPCEARCRRNMIDDAMNIRGLKRYAVDTAGDVAQPLCAAPTGKRVAVIGGGPGGLSAAYYLIFVFFAAFFQNFVLFQVKNLFSNNFGVGPAVTSSVEGIIARWDHVVKYTCQKNNETWQNRIDLPFPEKQGTIRSNIA